MWQVIYIATTKEEAAEVEERLQKAGFMVKMEAINQNEYQLKVLESEAEDVYKMLNNFQ
ncbi:MAG: hypothetical protein ACOCQH_02330 [Halanaerobiales bacterium]